MNFAHFLCKLGSSVNEKYLRQSVTKRSDFLSDPVALAEACKIGF